ISVPVMIGGAATSPEYTAIKIAPAYAPGLVVYVKDASQNPIIAANLLGMGKKEAIVNILDEQKTIRDKHEAQTPTVEEDLAKNRLILDWCGYQPKPVPFNGVKREVFSINDLIPMIDWVYFYHAWKVKGGTQEGLKLQEDAISLLNKIKREFKVATVANLGFFKAKSDTNGIALETEAKSLYINTPRKKASSEHKPNLALCDFVCPTGDNVGAFAVTLSAELREYYEQEKSQDDTYQAMLLQTVLDRLAEATSAALHSKYNWDKIRPAVGYPSLASQKAIFKLAQILDFEELGISLTETGAMYPQASVAGLYISHPEAKYFG
ncbi:MAG: hypothetical protein HUJ98_02685, partial [Bacteroidaceae bacterium]|nr:hypothetical protein [Bacteroidaceae bacterium]